MFKHSYRIHVIMLCLLRFGSLALGAGETREKTPTSGKPYRLQQNVNYLGAQRAEKLDVYLPDDGATSATRAAVIYIHGGGWVEGDKSWSEAIHCVWSLIDGGFAVFSIDYKLGLRPDKAAPGKQVSGYPQNIYDCKSAVQFVRMNSKRYGVDPARIGVMGASAGGHLALMTAFTAGDAALNRGTYYPKVSCAVSCVVDLYGIADVRPLAGPFFANGHQAPTQALLEQASPILRVKAGLPPVLMIHGDKDPTVKVEQSRALLAALQAKGVSSSLIEVKGGTHAFPPAPHPWNGQRDLRPALYAFLNRHLRP